MRKKPKLTADTKLLPSILPDIELLTNINWQRNKDEWKLFVDSECLPAKGNFFDFKSLDQ